METNKCAVWVPVTNLLRLFIYLILDLVVLYGFNSVTGWYSQVLVIDTICESDALLPKYRYLHDIFLPYGSD